MVVIVGLIQSSYTMHLSIHGKFRPVTRSTRTLILIHFCVAKFSWSSYAIYKHEGSIVMVGAFVAIICIMKYRRSGNFRIPFFYIRNVRASNVRHACARTLIIHHRKFFVHLIFATWAAGKKFSTAKISHSTVWKAASGEVHVYERESLDPSDRYIPWWRRMVKSLDTYQWSHLFAFPDKRRKCSLYCHCKLKILCCCYNVKSIVYSLTGVNCLLTINTLHCCHSWYTPCWNSLCRLGVYQLEGDSCTLRRRQLYFSFVSNKNLQVL